LPELELAAIPDSEFALTIVFLPCSNYAFGSASSQRHNSAIDYRHLMDFIGTTARFNQWSSTA
jgi:hypothetical protein